MATLAKYYAEFGAKDAGLGRMFDMIERRGAQTEKLLASAGKAAAIAGAAIAAGLGAAAFAMAKAANSAAETDSNIAALQSALAAAGNVGAIPAGLAFADFATQLQRTSRFTDDAAISAAAFGVRLGVPAEKLRALTQTAADFAQGSGQSLESAFDTIVKAGNGHVEMLQRMGLKFDEDAMKAGGLVSVMQLLNSHFAGAAAASVENYAGRLIVLGNAWGDVVKEAGAAISQNSVVNASLVIGAETLYKLQEAIHANQAAMTSWVTSGFSRVVDAIQWVISGLAIAGRAFAAFKVIGNLAIAGLITAFGELVSTAAAVVGTFSQILSLGGLSETRLSKQVGEAAIRMQAFADGLAEVSDTFNATAADGLDLWNEIGAGATKAGAFVDGLKDKVLELAKTMKFVPSLPGLPTTPKPPSAPTLPATGPLAPDLQASLMGTAGRFGAAAGKLGGVISGAQSGGAVGGPLGAAAGAIAAMVESSAGFQRVMAQLDPIIQSVSDSFGMLFEVAVMPMIPILKMFAETVRPIVALLQPLLRILYELNPAVLILAGVMKALAWVAKQLFGAIQSVALGILRAIKWVADRLGIHIGGLNSAIDQLTKTTWDSANAADRLAGAANAAAESLTNVPEGYKSALEHWRAMAGGPGSGRGGHGGGGGGSGPGTANGNYNDPSTIVPGHGSHDPAKSGSSSSAATSSGGWTINIHAGALSGITNAREFLDGIKREVARRNTAQSGTPIPMKG